MKTAFSCVLAILWPFLNAFCQPPARPLTVGDAVPDHLIRNLVNYKTPTARLSDFKDKLLILDFMTSYCGSCIANLFRMDTLESRYHDRLQVLPVTYEKKAIVQSFLLKPYMSKKITAPFVSQDSVLKSWFPHQFVSHLVWIHNGTVKAITRPEYVTAANIEAILRNEAVRLPVKKDVGYYDPATPLLAPNGETIAPANYPALKYYSVVPPYLDGFASASGLYKDTVNGLQRFYTINESILRLYLKACGQPVDFPATRIILQVADTAPFVFNGNGYRSVWKSKNYYSYEASFPLQTSLPAMQERMRADLNFHLQLDGRIEKRRVQCLVLKTASGSTLISAPPSDTIIQLSGLAMRLNQQYGVAPFFNEVPNSNQLYVELPASLNDLPALKKMLLLHGIEIMEEERELEMLVLRDNSKLL